MVVGGGAAGPVRRPRAPPSAGARVALVSRKPLAESASYWAQGGLAAALAPDDSPDAPRRGHARRRARPRAARAAVEVLRARRPARSTSSSARGVALRPDADGELALGARGRALARGGSSTPAAARPGARSPRGSPSWSPRTSGSRCSRATSALALWSDGERCAGVAHRPRARSRRAATVLATGGAAALWAAHDQPAGRDRRRLGARPRGRRGARRPRALPVPPDRARAARPSARRLAGHRGGPRRGRDAARRRRASGSPTSSRRATRSRAAILDRMEADGTDHVLLDLRAIDAGALPERLRGAAARRGSTRRASRSRSRPPPTT